MGVEVEATEIFKLDTILYLYVYFITRATTFVRFYSFFSIQTQTFYQMFGSIDSFRMFQFSFQLNIIDACVDIVFLFHALWVCMC